LANHKSSVKRAKQDIKKQNRNSQVKNSIKTWEKKLIKAVQEKSENIAALLQEYASQVMKASSKGVINKNTAARKMSRISKKANTAKTK